MASSPRRILIIRPSALGDVCRTVPVLVSLKRAYPNALIDWLVQDAFAPAVAAHPDLNRVLPFPRASLARWASPATWGPISRFLGSLREPGYDLVLDCLGGPRSGLFAAATGAPRRVGLANAAELGWLGLTEAVVAPQTMHTVDRMLLVAHAAGAPPVRDMRLHLAPGDAAFATQSLGLAPWSYLVLAPTTRWPAKQWPAENFAELAARLLQRLPPEQRVIYIGARHERDQCEALNRMAAAEPRLVDLVGRTTIGQVMAVIAGANLVVACDSAALHMAVGFDRPLVGMFGPTDVSRVGPYCREGDVVQHVRPGDRPDHKDQATGRVLMARISVDEVFAAASSRLSARVR